MEPVLEQGRVNSHMVPEDGSIQCMHSGTCESSLTRHMLSEGVEGRGVVTHFTSANPCNLNLLGTCHLLTAYIVEAE